MGPRDPLGAVRDVASDACYLINFLAVDRIDLLARRTDYRIHVPLEVDAEILRPEQRTRLLAAIDGGHLNTVELVEIPELTEYTGLLRELIGKGEAACLAIAIARGWTVASDERRRFGRLARERLPDRPVITTRGTLVEAVGLGHLTVDEAFAIQDALAADHSFRMTLEPDLSR
jgi:predicted nucleic acid-binding protein